MHSYNPKKNFLSSMTHQKIYFQKRNKNHEWNSIKRDLIISEQQVGFLSFMTFWISHNSTMVLLGTWVLLAIFIHGTLGHFWVIVICSPDPTTNFEFPHTIFYDLLTNLGLFLRQKQHHVFKKQNAWKFVKMKLEICCWIRWKRFNI